MKKAVEWYQKAAAAGDITGTCYLGHMYEDGLGVERDYSKALQLDQNNTAVQPKLAVIMETELWPNHINQCAKRGIPVALANARLSERSARGYGRFARLTQPMLAQMSLIAVQTEAEAERFRQLGARPECVEVTGSIKFDLSIDPQLLVRAGQLRAQWQADRRPVWIAASTHEGEDAIILQAHRDRKSVV